MDRGEPALVPEWYKGSGSNLSGGSNRNHHARSPSHSDEHNTVFPSRNRLSVSGCNHDTLRPSGFTDRSLASVRRSASSNGSIGYDKGTSAHLRPYGSFGRSYRDGDREKELDLRDRDRSLLLGNGYSDPFLSSRTEKDTLRRSRSMVSGQQVDLSTKKPGKDLNNGAHSGGSIGKTSFERDFPSLGSEDKRGYDLIRVSSPGPSTSIQNLLTGASALVGGNGWTSALTEVPVKVGGSGPVPSFALQTAPSTALSMTVGLNMAEALSQAPPRVRNASQLSVDTQRIEELTRIQYTKLIPVTPSMSKSSNLNSSDKSKSKAAKSGDVSAPPKVGQQSSSQLVSQTLLAPARSATLKTFQSGNFQVLNRERNDILPATKDSPNLINTTRVVTLPAALLKIPINPKVKADRTGGILTLTQSTFGEKRPQAQNRSDFFNSLRKKTSANQLVATESSCITPSNNTGKACELSDGISSSINQEDNSASNLGLDPSAVKGSDVSRVCDVSQEHEKSVPDDTNKSSSEADDPEEEEAAFMRSLGWQENAVYEALTVEEIDAFHKKYGKQLPYSKQSHRDL